MNCKNLGIIGKIADISQPSIVKGSDAFLVAQLIYKGTSDVAKVSNFLGATGFFPQQDSAEPLVVDGTLESADLGQIRFSIPASGTQLLKASDELSWEFSVEDDNGLRFIQYEGTLQISDRIF